MFAVMKHWDLMLGIDRHICWPPKSPIPLPKPVPYVTIMILHGIQPLTPMMAKSSMTLYGWTMQRGTDIGPGIPHIGTPSILTPLDILFSSSVSYFGPQAYQHEAEPCAAALLVAINLNANCQEPVSLPTGLVFCVTTHYTWMSPLDILYGFACMAFDALLEYAGGKFGEFVGPIVMRKVVNPIGKKVMSKITSKTAAKTASGAAAGAASKTASGAAAGAASKAGSDAAGGAAARTGSGAAGSQTGKTPGATRPALGGHRPGPSPGPSGPRPSSPRPAGKPQLGGHRPPGPAPAGPRPPSPGKPGASPGQRPPSSWQPAKPGTRPPGDVWVPGKPSGPRPGNAPTVGAHRDVPKRPSIFQIYKDLGWDVLKDLGMEAPMSLVHMGGMELLALTGIEEFGAPPEEQGG